jgi:hypothetical protein
LTAHLHQKISHRLQFHQKLVWNNSSDFNIYQSLPRCILIHFCFLNIIKYYLGYYNTKWLFLILKVLRTFGILLRLTKLLLSLRMDQIEIFWELIGFYILKTYLCSYHFPSNLIQLWNCIDLNLLNLNLNIWSIHWYYCIDIVFKVHLHTFGAHLPKTKDKIHILDHLNLNIPCLSHHL